jgi:hypothetical protein
MQEPKHGWRHNLRIGPSALCALYNVDDLL